MSHVHTWKELARAVVQPLPSHEVDRVIDYLQADAIERLLGGYTTIIRECTQCAEEERIELLGCPTADGPPADEPAVVGQAAAGHWESG